MGVQFGFLQSTAFPYKELCMQKDCLEFFLGREGVKT